MIINNSENTVLCDNDNLLRPATYNVNIYDEKMRNKNARKVKINGQNCECPCYDLGLNVTGSENILL